MLKVAGQDTNIILLKLLKFTRNISTAQQKHYDFQHLGIKLIFANKIVTKNKKGCVAGLVLIFVVVFFLSFTIMTPKLPAKYCEALQKKGGKKEGNFMRKKVMKIKMGVKKQG